MARPHRSYPVPSLRKVANSYKIRWYADSTHYQITLGNVDKEQAKRLCVATAAAFAMGKGFPEEIAGDPALHRFLQSKNPVAEQKTDAFLIEKYMRHLAAKCHSTWLERVKYFLEKAENHMGTLGHASTSQIVEFLDAIAEDISPASRNRAQISLSGFYRYLRTVSLIPKNMHPMEGIKQVREERPHDGIIIWEKDEVAALLKAADTRKDGIAVWIAILAGLRRGEIPRLDWTDITPAYILVGKSKTGVKRQVPLSAALAKRLEKETNKSGRVVPWPEAMHGWMTAARRLVEEYLPKRLPDLYKAHPEKFGWNPFRHTFASRHAQTGLSLDIIATWLGDSPRVCKEHYARYVPKNVRDNRIDAADPDVDKPEMNRPDRLAHRSRRRLKAKIQRK